MIVNTEPVTVEDAYERRLWEHGTLMLGVSRVLNITVNTLGFSIYTDSGTHIKDAGNWIDYTPNVPKPTHTRAPHIIETLSIEAALEELARLAEENEALKAENVVLTSEVAFLTYEIGRLRRLFKVSS